MPDDKTRDEQQIPFHKRLVRHKAFLPFLLFIAIVILFSVSSQFSDRPPVIKDITPEIGNPGDVLIIEGAYLGETRQGGEVHIAGVRPTSSSYLEWSEERISVRIPPNVGSGLVYVITRNGRSNGVLFTNKQHIPVVLEGPAQPGYPHVKSITPLKGSVGTLITLTGQNFGASQGNGTVYFTPSAIIQNSSQEEDADIEGMIPASECDYDIESWNDRKIEVYVPDGVTSGNLKVKTDRGTSNSLYFEVADPLGTKQLKQKRGYQIEYGVQIREVEAETENSLYVWVPMIFRCIYQTNIEGSFNPKPYWENYSNVLVYLFEDMDPFHNYKVSHTVWFERYSVETQINEEKIDSNYNETRKLYQIYTSQDFLVPSNDPKIVKEAELIVGREENPYLKAKRIYTYLINEYEFNQTPQQTTVVKSLDKKIGDEYIFSILFTAFCRSVGIPARSLSGYLVYGNKNTKIHYWNEFYIEQFGWVPVDSVLGGGNRFGDVPNTDNPQNFYFGNMDNQHIIFSRGITKTNQVLPQGKLVGKERSFSFQQIYEEASTEVEEYQSEWENVRIVDWW